MEVSKLLFDIKDFLIVYREGDDIGYTESQVKQGSTIIETYKSDNPDRVAILYCDNVRIYIKRYPNKQIRSEILVRNHEVINDSYGFITMPMNTKNCRIGKLNDSRILKQVYKQPKFKRQIEETFYTSENSEIRSKTMKVNSF